MQGVWQTRVRQRAAGCAVSLIQLAETSAAPKRQDKLARPKGSGEAHETYIIAAGILDVRAAAAPSPTVAVALQKGSCQVLVQVTKINGWVLL
jgi:hypothetical protein